jgi:hypothetical protein
MHTNNNNFKNFNFVFDYYYGGDRTETNGCGHHGVDCIGKASERAGKGIRCVYYFVIFGCYNNNNS